MLLTENEERIEAIYMDLVSVESAWCEDAAETAAGELVRAVVGIWYKFHSDKKTLSTSEPDRDLNSLARFIQTEYAGTEMATVVGAMWDLENGELYKVALEMLLEKTVQYLDEHSELYDKVNECDCLDYYELADMADDGNDEEGMETYEWQRQQDLQMYPKRSC